MQVRELVLKLIAQRKIAVGEPLPSDLKLAKMSGVSLQPVTRAMQELEREGLVVRRAGAATLVRSENLALDDSGYSFTTAAQKSFKGTVTTRIVELVQRHARNESGYEHENAALRALGLRVHAEFLVLSRLRLFNQTPRVLHRSYLNPANHSPDFLVSKDFARESLIGAFNAEGYQIIRRDTALSARKSTELERRYLGKDADIVLDAQQELSARHDKHGQLTIEFLAAVYVDWSYKVTNRPSLAACS